MSKVELVPSVSHLSLTKRAPNSSLEAMRVSLTHSRQGYVESISKAGLRAIVWSLRHIYDRVVTGIKKRPYVK